MHYISLTNNKEDVDGSGGATPVGDTTCIEGSIAGTHSHQGQLVG